MSNKEAWKEPMGAAAARIQLVCGAPVSAATNQEDENRPRDGYFFVHFITFK